MIQDQLNNRPRKRLGFKTPSEVFMQSLNRVALRVLIYALNNLLTSYKTQPYFPRLFVRTEINFAVELHLYIHQCTYCWNSNSSK